MLIQDTEQTMLSLLTSKQGTVTAEQQAKNFHQKMLHGKVKGAVRYLCPEIQVSISSDSGHIISPHLQHHPRLCRLGHI
jgi:hypothetical protein